MNPVTPEMLRGDWVDRPGLSEEGKRALIALTDEQLQEALDSAFNEWEDMWFAVLDNTQGDATRRLLTDLGFEDDADKT